MVLHSLGHPGLDDLTRKIYEICECPPFQMSQHVMAELFNTHVSDMRADE